MSFLQEATGEYLGRTKQEDAVLIGDGSVFVIPKKRKTFEKYSPGFARQRFLEEACQAEVGASMCEEFSEQDDLPDLMRQKETKLLNELLEEQRNFTVLAEFLREYK